MTEGMGVGAEGRRGRREGGEGRRGGGESGKNREGRNEGDTYVAIVRWPVPGLSDQVPGGAMLLASCVQSATVGEPAVVWLMNVDSSQSLLRLPSSLARTPFAVTALREVAGAQLATAARAVAAARVEAKENFILLVVVGRGLCQEVEDGWEDGIDAAQG